MQKRRFTHQEKLPSIARGPGVVPKKATPDRGESGRGVARRRKRARGRPQPTSMRRGWLSGVLGMLIERTPLSKLASISSALAACGSEKER